MILRKICGHRPHLQYLESFSAACQGFVRSFAQAFYAVPGPACLTPAIRQRDVCNTTMKREGTQKARKRTQQEHKKRDGSQSLVLFVSLRCLLCFFLAVVQRVGTRAVNRHEAPTNSHGTFPRISEISSDPSVALRNLLPTKALIR